MTGTPAYLFYQRDFITPLLFPQKAGWQGLKILDLSGDDGCRARLEEQFPEARVEPGDIGALLTSKKGGRGPYDYIVGLRLGTGAVEPVEVLSALLEISAPGGIIAASGYGYAGYYAPAMIAAVVKKLTEGKEQADRRDVALRLLKELPHSHPLRLREEFFKRLESGESSAVDEILALDPTKIFSVSRLLELVEQCGASWLDWLVPGWYDPTHPVRNGDIAAVLRALPETKQWRIAELVGASPPEHHFFLYRDADRPLQIPWDADDILHWRPLRLPLYDWSNLKPADAETHTLHPLKPFKFLQPLPLQKRETQLCPPTAQPPCLKDILKGRLDAPTRAALKRLTLWRALALLPPDHQ
jgi:hypothetical protein